MGFPNIDWVTVQSHLDEVFDVQGTPTSVRLHPEGNVIAIKAVRGHRRDEALTDGMLQQGFKVRVLAADWDLVAPRRPQQGDRVRMLGREHAIEDVHLLAVGNTLLMYVMIIKG